MSAADPGLRLESRLAPLLALTVVLAGSVLRLAYLDADPDYYSWAGYITDEGRWVGHAREVALFGRVVNTDWLLHLHMFLAPLFQAISYIAFELFGVSIWSARLPTAIAGSVVLGLFWLALRRAVTAPALVVGLSLLAFDVDLIELSRVSVPEMAGMLAQLAVYAVVVTPRATSPRLFAGGLLLAAAVAVKVTNLPMLIIFSVIVLTSPIEEPNGKRRGRNLFTFWAGFLLPLLVIVSLAVACCRASAGVAQSSLRLLEPFLTRSSTYSVVSFFFSGALAPTINVWAVGVFLPLAAWLGRPLDAKNSSVLPHFVSSAIWCGLYTPIMLSLDYFPDRYKAHILVPLAINIATGITLAEAASQTAAGSAVAGLPRGRRVVLLILLTLPTAVLWAPALAGVAAHIGMDAARLRTQLVCVLIAGILTGWSLRRAALTSSAPRIFFIFPVVAVIGWTVCVRTGLDEGRFWPVPGGGRAAWWSVGLPIAAVLATTLATIGRRWSRERWISLVPVAVLCYAVLAAARVAPAYVVPHFSMKQVSRDLGLSLANSTGVVATANGEGLFNENSVPYRAIAGRTWPWYRPDVIVIVFAFHDYEGLLGREYQLTATYPLYTSPEARRSAVVRVYRRRAPGG